MLSSNCEHHLSNPILFNELILKLPMSTRITWSIHSASIDGHPNIKDFSDWIEKLADNIDRIPIGSVSMMNHTEKKIILKKANICHTSENPSYQKHHCSFCQSEHFIANCQQFFGISQDEKWSVLKEKKALFLLFKSRTFDKELPKKKILWTKRMLTLLLLHNNGTPVEKETLSRSSNPAINCHATAKESHPKVLFKMLRVKLYRNKGIVLHMP